MKNISKAKVNEKTQSYMSLPYKKRIIAALPNQGGGYYAEIPLLGACSTYAWGNTEEKALETLKVIMENNFRMWLSEDISIPVPEKHEEKHEE